MSNTNPEQRKLKQLQAQIRSRWSYPLQRFHQALSRWLAEHRRSGMPVPDIPPNREFSKWEEYTVLAAIHDVLFETENPIKSSQYPRWLWDIAKRVGELAFGSGQRQRLGIWETEAVNSRKGFEDGLPFRLFM